MASPKYLKIDQIKRLEKQLKALIFLVFFYFEADVLKSNRFSDSQKHLFINTKKYNGKNAINKSH